MNTPRRSGRRRHGPIVDINMVPLIDVSLVLLIIFMVMTPFLVQQQIKINLPQAVTGHEAPDRPIVVILEKQGEVHVNDKSISANLLEAELSNALKDDPARPVVIQADKEIAFQRVVSVMDLAKRLNVEKLGISVDAPKK
jgi:biopolymer transport protein ExbD